jgi:hypothetical protein
MTEYTKTSIVLKELEELEEPKEPKELKMKELIEVIQRMRFLPEEHPDRNKFLLEQARLRVDYSGASYLVDLVEPNWKR